MRSPASRLPRRRGRSAGVARTTARSTWDESSFSSAIVRSATGCSAAAACTWIHPEERNVEERRLALEEGGFVAARGAAVDGVTERLERLRSGGPAVSFDLLQAPFQDPRGEEGGRRLLVTKLLGERKVVVKARHAEMMPVVTSPKLSGIR